MKVAEVQELLAELDPMGLTRIGASRDEYSPKAALIVGGAPCRDVFVAMFSKDLVKGIDFEELQRRVDALSERE